VSIFLPLARSQAVILALNPSLARKSPVWRIVFFAGRGGREKEGGEKGGKEGGVWLWMCMRV